MIGRENWDIDFIYIMINVMFAVNVSFIIIKQSTWFYFEVIPFKETAELSCVMDEML